MKEPRHALVMGLIIVVAAMAGKTKAHEDEIQENVKTFMRAKLKHSQQVLEGLTLEDYGTIAKNSQELILLSNATQWQVFQTPEYVRRSAEFRSAADALMKSAEEKNLDGAAMNYVKLTLRCVECHKYVRSVRQARLDNLFWPDNEVFVAESLR